MIYLAITAAIFTLDFFIKKYIDRKYARKVKYPRLGGKAPESHDCNSQRDHGFCRSLLLFYHAL